MEGAPSPDDADGPGDELDDFELPRLDPRDPVSVEVARKLLGYFLSGRAPVGRRLPSERVLASQLGVGRSAIRDALKPLALLGVIEVRPGSGSYLKATTSELLPEVVEWGLLLGEQSLNDLIEARRFVEVALARLSAERRDESVLAELRQAVAQMAAAADVEAFTEADMAFHLRLAESAQNEVLAGIVKNIRTLLKVWIRRVVTAGADRDAIRDDHLAIVEAIERGDPDAAAVAMERHLSTVTQRLREGLEAELGDGVPHEAPAVSG
jgi:GntR family transcriptional repressor for pyruvate dehydrogenase complex